MGWIVEGSNFCKLYFMLADMPPGGGVQDDPSLSISVPFPESIRSFTEMENHIGQVVTKFLRYTHTFNSKQTGGYLLN